MLEHARPEVARAVQQLCVIDEDVIPVRESRVLRLPQGHRPPVRHFLCAQCLQRFQVRGQACLVQLLPRAECAEQQQLRAGDPRMLREELDQTGLARGGRGGEEDARA
jgi:hypothetical protein